MEDKNPTYKIANVLMVESYFQREIEIDLNNSGIKHEVEVDVHVGVPEEKLVQSLVSVDYALKINDESVVRSRVSFIGAFECSITLDKVALEKFGHINGAAIIFPYVREQLSSLILKSGINSFLLPPYNFVERYNRLEKK